MWSSSTTSPRSLSPRTGRRAATDRGPHVGLRRVDVRALDDSALTVHFGRTRHPATDLPSAGQEAPPRHANRTVSAAVGRNRPRTRHCRHGLDARQAVLQSRGLGRAVVFRFVGIRARVRLGRWLPPRMPIDQHLLVLFTLATVVAMVTPGPDMLFVLGCGMRGGPRAGLLATAGVATSEAIHVIVAAAGLAALFAAVPVAFTVVRTLGAAYLVYLGVQAIRHRGRTAVGEPVAGGMSGRRAYLTGMATNLLNPKMVTFTIAFLPQFVDPDLGQVWLQFAILGAILIALEFLVDGAVGVLAGRIGGWLRRRHAARRRIDVATGGVFIGLGVRLAVER